MQDQLIRNLMVPKEKSFGWVAAASALLALLGNSMQLQAQITPTAETTPVKIYTSADQPQSVKVSPSQKVPLTVSGTIIDADGGIPGASVAVAGTDIQTHTNIEGIFGIKAKQGDKLLISSLGMHDASYVISDHFNGIAIVLTEDESVEGVMTGGIHFEKRTFFGRLLQRIGSWFR